MSQRESATKYYRKKLLLGQIEGENDTAAIRFVGTEVTWNPLGGRELDREIQQPAFGASPTLLVEKQVEIGFAVEFGGLGDDPVTGDSAPGWDPLLRACGFARTFVEAAGSTLASLVYNPITGGEDCLTLTINIDGVQQVASGCRGSVSLEISPNAIPRLQFAFLGSYAPLTDARTQSDPDYTAYRDPVIPGHTNTPSFVLHGINDLVLKSLSLDMQIERVRDEAINKPPVTDITGRNPAGKLTLETPAVGKVALVDKAASGETGPLQLVHGTATGHIIEITAPKVQLKTPSFGESNGIWTTEMDWVPLPTTAFNNEIIITVR